MKVTGSCLCQKIKFSFLTNGSGFESCHCSICRKWNGGPALTIDVKSDLDITGEEFVQIYDSSEWAERGFCKSCGTNLFYRLKDENNPFCNFNLGLIDQQNEFSFKTQIYIDSKPSNYSFANNTKMLTEQEVIDLFQGNQKE